MKADGHINISLQNDPNEFFNQFRNIDNQSVSVVTCNFGFLFEGLLVEYFVEAAGVSHRLQVGNPERRSGFWG